MTPWEIHAIEVANCNCAYGCPCQFNSLPTYGNCEAAVGIILNEGHYGGVSLNGMNVASTVKFPGPIHEGDGESQLIIDERASAEQRLGIEKIVSGEDTEEMATIFWVMNAMTSTRHETLFKQISIEVDMDARTGRVDVDGVFVMEAVPIKNPVTGQEHRARIDIPNGFEFTIAEMASGTTETKGVVDLPKNDSTYAQICELHMNNFGLIK